MDENTSDESLGVGFGGREVTFSEAPTTPEEGRVRLSEEESNVLEKIEELKQTDVPEFKFKDPGDTAYVPVADSMLPYLEKRRRENRGFTINDKDLLWWKDDTFIPKHPFILLNPTNLSPRNYHYHAGIVRDWMGLDWGDVFVFADSGGFQVVREGRFEVTDDLNKHDWKNFVHPHRVVEWQMANADAGTILDIPVYRTTLDHKGFGTDDWQEWYDGLYQESKELTVRNAERAVERYEELDFDRFDLLPVLHGMPRQDGDGSVLEAYQDWFEALDGMRDWNGWSLSVRSYDNPGQNTILACFAIENIQDCDYLHLLGLGSAWARVVAKFLAKITDTFVTMDGTGFKIASIYSTMYLPTTYMKSVRMTERDQSEEDVRYEVLEPEAMPCGCSVCRQVERHMGAKEMFEKPGTERMVIMDQHNLNHLLRRFYLMDSFIEARGADLLDEAELVERDDGAVPVKVKAHSDFWRILSDWFSMSRVVEIYYCMDLMVQTEKHGFEEAFEDYGVRTPFNKGLPASYGDGRPSIYSKKWDAAIDSTSSVFEW